MLGDARAGGGGDEHRRRRDVERVRRVAAGADDVEQRVPGSGTSTLVANSRITCAAAAISPMVSFFTRRPTVSAAIITGDTSPLMIRRISDSISSGKISRCSIVRCSASGQRDGHGRLVSRLKVAHALARRVDATGERALVGAAAARVHRQDEVALRLAILGERPLRPRVARRPHPASRSRRRDPGGFRRRRLRLRESVLGRRVRVEEAPVTAWRSPLAMHSSGRGTGASPPRGAPRIDRSAFIGAASAAYVKLDAPRCRPPAPLALPSIPGRCRTLRRVAHRRPSRKLREQRVAVLGEERLGVELHALDGERRGGARP